MALPFGNFLARQSPDSFVSRAAQRWLGYEPPAMTTTETAPPQDTTMVGDRAFNDWIWQGEAPDDWWRTPGLEGRHLSALEAAGNTTPEWAFFEGSRFDTPGDFYRGFQDVNPELQEEFLQEQRVLADQERSRQAALELFGDMNQRLLGGFEAWEADPYRTAAMDALLEQSSPDYSIVTPEQQSQIELQIAQQRATQEARAQAAAAGRGTAAGGAHTGRQTAINAYADAAGLQADALIAAENARARSAAATTLGRLAGANESIDLAYQNALDRATALEADTIRDVQDPDSAAWAGLDLAFQEFEQGVSEFEQAVQEYEESKEPSFDKFWTRAMDLGGTGFYRWLFNWIGGLSSQGA